MGDLWFQFVAAARPTGPGSAARCRSKMTAEDIIGHETMLRSTPGDTALHDDAAVLALLLGRPAAAVAHFRVTAEHRPDSAAAHYNLGTALTSAGLFDDAIASYERALQLQPRYPKALNNLGDTLASMGRLEQAIARYEASVAVDPAMAETRNNLGSALWRRGDYARAERELREALRLRPGYAEAYYNLGHVAMRTGDAAAAGRQFRQAAVVRPDWALAQTTAAWVLATAPDAEARAPADAVGIRRTRGDADRAPATPRRSTCWRRRWPRRVASTRRSGSAARRSGWPAPPLKEAIAARLALFERGEAFVDRQLAGRLPRAIAGRIRFSPCPDPSLRRSWPSCAPAFSTSRSPARPTPIRGFSSDAAAAQRALEERFRAIPDAARLREYMKAMSAEPHVAGRPGSKVVAEYALEKFKSFGLDATIEVAEAYMPWPRERRLEMVQPTGRAMLIQEPPVPQDPDSLDEDQTPTYNAYSIDGDVTDAAGVRQLRRACRLRGARSRRGIEREGQDRDRALWRILARHQAEGRGGARRGGVPHLLRSTHHNGYFQGDAYPTRAHSAESGECSAAPSLDMPVFAGDPLTPGIGATPYGKEPGAHRGPADTDKDPRAANLLRRCEAVAGGARRSCGT